MRTVNFTQLRQNLAAELDSVVNDAEEVVVTRSGHEPNTVNLTCLAWSGPTT
ncbi:type II toxin-antitoxin system Phd/YefM family antitoxin [Solwaraspora sp. WMMA2080]|uniref:type II toxin-antitoxin system Phd/YefM family antitoxin n=1 Tax=unclassified Solwaraspora TaxID=2627926 RepID=UPI0032B2238C